MSTHINTSRIRAVRHNDLPRLLQINKAAVPHVGKIKMPALEWFAENAQHFRVAEQDGNLAGFIIVLEPGMEYTSLNYRWFVKRFRSFAYVDRIAIAEEFRYAGLGRRLYEDLYSQYQARVPRVTCEVNIEPPNPGSLRFHQRQGFSEIGQLETDNGSKRVSLMEKVFIPYSGRR